MAKRDEYKGTLQTHCVYICTIFATNTSYSVQFDIFYSAKYLTLFCGGGYFKTKINTNLLILTNTKLFERYIKDDKGYIKENNDKI